MSVYIKDMELPKGHVRVLVLHPDGRVIDEWGNTYQAASLPPHGRLIDADALYEDCALDHSYEVEATTTRINEYMQIKIDAAPTVIPAGPSEAQREYEASVEQMQYCELHEPTYDPDTGAL